MLLHATKNLQYASVAVTAGTRLGPYEVTSLLGEGGMGEVWKARDTRLGRDVALKVLPAEFVQDSSRRNRFEHEARAVAALNHPNILGLYDIGNSDSIQYMVTELVAGETLRQATLPLRKALDIAAQIADGLAAAHAAGVTHRDLKPDNIMVTHDGRAKILDFGLSKVELTAVGEGPTITRTEPGLLLGTVGYMSPEQVRGTEAGPLSDIFSFGAVLYEIIAGKRAFDGETAVEVMNAILKEDPEQLPDNVPSGVCAIVGHCLEKKPGQRFQSAQDLAFALRSVSAATTASSTSLTVLPASRLARMRWLFAPLLVAAGVLIGGAVALRWAASFDAGIDPIKLTRFAAEPEQESFPAFSPDGRSVAYIRGTIGNFELVVKPLDAPPSVSPVALATGQFQGSPVWTPDSTRVCYSSLRDLWCVSAAGGKPQRLLADVASAAFSRDGNSLLFIRIENGKPSLLVSSPPGSEPKVVEGVTLPDGAADLREISPDGTKLLLGNRNFSTAWVAPYPTGQPKKLEAPPSWTPLPAGWLPDSRHAVVIEASDNLRFRLVLTDTESSVRRLVAPDTGAIISAAVSPDGKRIMYSTGQPDWDIGEYSMDGKRLRPIAVSPEMDISPSWSPSGDRFLYGVVSSRSGSIWTRSADGSGASILANASAGLYKYSPDGRRIAGATRDIRGIGIETMPAAGGRTIRIVSATDINNLCWSPDGEWLWYASAGKLAKVPSQGGQSVSVHDSVEGLIDCSPDGRLIAYTKKDGIHLISPEGQQDRLLTSEGFYSLASGLYGLRGQFSKSGDVLYLLRDDARSIDVIDTITGKLQRSIQFELAHADIISQFSIHPDGTRVLLCTGGLRYDLWMAEGFAQPAKGWMRWFRHWDTPTSASGESLNQTAQ